MIKIKLITSLALILLLAFTVGAEEKQETTKNSSLELGLYTGYTDFKDLDSAVQFGLIAAKEVSENLMVEFRAGYMNMSIDKEYDSIDKGDLKIVPLQLSLMYRFKMNKLKPYVAAGAGYYIVSFDHGSKAQLENLGFRIEDSMDNKLGFHLGAGLDYQIAEKFIFNADLRYAFVNLGGSYKITDQASNTANTGNYDGKLNNLMISVGFKYSL